MFALDTFLVCHSFTQSVTAVTLYSFSYVLILERTFVITFVTLKVVFVNFIINVSSIHRPSFFSLSVRFLAVYICFYLSMFVCSSLFFCQVLCFYGYFVLAMNIIKYVWGRKHHQSFCTECLWSLVHSYLVSVLWNGTRLFVHAVQQFVVTVCLVYLLESGQAFNTM